jgi:DnaJ-class molecular chaperone
MTPDPLRDAGWWERKLAVRNGSDRGMAEFVVATLRAAQFSAAFAAQPTTPPLECLTCDGDGWVSGIGADPLPSGEPGEPYQVQETCPDCGGAGQAQPTPPPLRRVD